MFVALAQNTLQIAQAMVPSTDTVIPGWAVGAALAVFSGLATVIILLIKAVKHAGDTAAQTDAKSTRTELSTKIGGLESTLSTQIAGFTSLYDQHRESCKNKFTDLHGSLSRLDRESKEMLAMVKMLEHTVDEIGVVAREAREAAKEARRMAASSDNRSKGGV